MSQLDECLYEEFATQGLISRFADCIGVAIEFDRLGIATRVSKSEMEVLAIYSDGQLQKRHRGRRFEYRGTVGEWVWNRKQPFIGRMRSEVKAFPTTYRQFETDGMESNCVIALRLPDRGPTFVYWLSKKKCCYSLEQLPLLLRACEYLKPLMMFSSEIDRVGSLSGNTLDRAMNQLFLRGAPHGADSAGLPTLDEMQTHYIKRVLEQTRGTIEGPDGAAAILGLPSSTLRSRMQRLGIERK